MTIQEELERHPILGHFILDALSLCAEEAVEKWVYDNLNPFSAHAEFARRYILRHTGDSSEWRIAGV